MTTPIYYGLTMQRLGNMADEGAVCHINGQCYQRQNGILEPVRLSDYYKATRGHASEIETWDPVMEGNA
jgi:hypothetical protein